MRTISLAFSPCPNDTYLFYAWVHGEVAQNVNVRISPTLADIETLNSAAKQGSYAVTKLSLSAYPGVWERYQMLPVGAAFGKGYGPKVVGLIGCLGSDSGYDKSDKDIDLTELLKGKRVAIPGAHTTAFWALRMLYGSAFTPMFCPYNHVLQHVKDGRADYGLLIHETRTHFAHEGAEELVDLGEEWHRRYGLFLPLGGLFMQRALSPQTRHQIVQALRDSLAFAKQFPQRIQPYILEHAQEKESHVIQQHINLYVTEETRELTPHAKESILHFFACGEERGWWPRTPQDWLWNEET